MLYSSISERKIEALNSGSACLWQQGSIKSFEVYVLEWVCDHYFLSCPLWTQQCIFFLVTAANIPDNHYHVILSVFSSVLNNPNYFNIFSFLWTALSLFSKLFPAHWMYSKARCFSLIFHVLCKLFNIFLIWCLNLQLQNWVVGNLEQTPGLPCLLHLSVWGLLVQHCLTI